MGLLFYVIIYFLIKEEVGYKNNMFKWCRKSLENGKNFFEKNKLWLNSEKKKDRFYWIVVLYFWGI